MSLKSQRYFYFLIIFEMFSVFVRISDYDSRYRALLIFLLFSFTIGAFHCQRMGLRKAKGRLPTCFYVDSFSYVSR